MTDNPAEVAARLTKADIASVLRELTHVKAAFQLRTIAMHIGAPPPAMLERTDNDR